jgi:energy-coupling factor transport system ATP-binding protein
MGSPLLVLDEPTANLDPQGIEEVYAPLGELVAAGDRAIVLVEHNLDAAASSPTGSSCSIDGRRTVADGTVDEVLRRRAPELHEMGVWLPVATLAACGCARPDGPRSSRSTPRTAHGPRRGGRPRPAAPSARPAEPVSGPPPPHPPDTNR